MGLVEKVKHAVTGDHASTTSPARKSSQSSTMHSGVSTHSTGLGATSTSSAAPTGPVEEVCNTQNAPVVQETLREHRAVEVQPIIEREHEQTIVQQVVQPVRDHQAATHHHYAENAAITREVQDELSTDDARRYQQNLQSVHSGRKVENLEEGVITNAPVIHEKVNTHVIEEVQPVIERTIDETHVVHTTQPIYEHHTASPRVADVRYAKPLTMEEFEARGGSMSGTGLHCERK
ncbi:hypothetical protein HDU85_001565 [Gaertneriomyces sp. JEL0708]|nr:hypothetical protein HDU85_001565 [Gaertneriomyces sp. JEL0708]